MVRQNARLPTANVRKAGIVLWFINYLAISGILVVGLLFVSHLHTVELTLGDGTDVVVGGDVALELLQVLIGVTYIGDVIGAGTLGPLLGADEVVPTVALTPELTAALVEDVVDGDGGRRGSYHLGTMVDAYGHIVVLVEGLLTGTCTQHVHVVVGAGVVAELHGSLSGQEIELGELGDAPRTRATAVDL